MDTLPPGTNAENETLARACEAVAEAASGAIAWIGEQPGRVREEGPAMVRDFRREALRARKLAAAARRAMCVSVFGPSQSGKSYLISALARKDQQPAKVVFDGRVLDIVRDINPEGGKEATGLVTRFSIRPVPGLPGLPVALRLLSQTDIVKIIANAFMEDFNRDTVVPLERGAIDAAITALKAKASRDPVDRMTDDDVYDCFEYFERYFKNHPAHAALKPATWREMEWLAPRLAVPDRAALFGLLWNGIPEMTALAADLMGAIASLDDAAEAFCPIEALVPKSRSVIDVATLFGLGRDDGDRVAIGTRSGRRAELPRAAITAIIAELQLQLAEKPFDFFDHTDLLDFPGARSRETYDAGRAQQAVAANLYHLFLRGKVAYLYQRYLADQELTSMLLCLADGNQEVRTLPAMVTDWVNSTHGDTPERRQGQDTALFLVLTKFDKEFVSKAGADDDNVARWSIRIDTTINNFLALDHDWPRQWTPGRPFSNTFWLRNPNAYDEGLVEYDKGDGKPDTPWRELTFRDKPRIDRLRERFANNDDVKRHFANPEAAWDAAMALNDGGIGFLAERLRPVCNPALKRRQVSAQLAELARRMAARLEPYHVSGDIEAELAKRRAEARKVGRSLLACAEAQAFGLMLRALQVEAEALAELFRRETLSAGDGGAVATPVGARAGGKSLRDDFEALFEDDAALEPEPAQPADAGPADMAELLARVAVAEWNDGMHRFAARPDTPALFRIDRDGAAVLVGALAAGARRQRLTEAIAERMRAGAGYHERLTDRMIKPVMIAERAINDFVTWMGFDRMPVEARPKAGRSERPVFTRPEAAEEIPPLAETPLAYDATFYLDWATAFVRLVEDNVRDQGGAAVDIAANAKLGQLLAGLRQAAA
jgi:hypothetical protein